MLTFSYEQEVQKIIVMDLETSFQMVVLYLQMMILVEKKIAFVQYTKNMSS
ncbi:hypothetical protein LZB76_05660 [Campylobacter lari]|uniref:hypothetical protein n=1 Tax=Campylobacter lari TaxID=201 RepID=UPI001F091A03|nr:hypothetical protein [Campylobacter lari]MCH3690184.1 hypothetical protein [Campylobacter lari]